MGRLAVGAGALVAATVTSWVLVRIVRAWARRIGFVDNPGSRKFHREPTAYGGGIAIFAAVWLVVGAGALVGWLLHKAPPSWLPEEVAVHLPGMLTRAGQLGVLFAGSAVLFALGLYDDMRGLGPLLKFVVMVGVALGVAASGIRITFFVPWPWLHYLATVAWIVAVINAINLLDNMDGLSSGVAAIAAGSFFLVAAQFGQWFVALFLLTLIGALLGFLWYNFNPASIFMGDAGSLTIGFLLATLTIKGTFYQPGRLWAVLLPLVVLAVPLYDTTSVILLRIKLGKPIYIGDTNHFSHRLVRMGMSTRRAVLTMYLMTLCTGVGAALLCRVDTGGAVLVGAQTLFVLLLVTVLERESRLAAERAAEQEEDRAA